MEETESEVSSFLSHLIELRDRIIKALAAIFVFCIFLFPFRNELYDFLSQPIIKAMPAGQGELIATGVVSPFLTPVKLTILVSFLITLPYVLYQVWAFIAPGLYQNEKKWMLPIVFSSVLLFFIGMLFAYYAVFPVAFGFIQSSSPDSILVMPDIEQYFSFVLNMFIAFGITFEVPIVVLVLVRLNVVSLETLIKIRPFIIVIAFVIAAIVTPPDPISQLLLATPLCLLYQFGITICKYLPPKKE